MESEAIANMTHSFIMVAVSIIEVLAVTLVLVAILYGTFRYLFHFVTHVEESYEHYREQLGKTLLLGLQLLVAADVVRTVALEPTMANVAVLGLLVLGRTFLSWSTVIEIEGHWPWHDPGQSPNQNRTLTEEPKGHSLSK
jgi:uncharacterized membrane protein